jgi:hypothetical protein
MQQGRQVVESKSRSQELVGVKILSTNDARTANVEGAEGWSRGRFALPADLKYGNHHEFPSGIEIRASVMNKYILLMLDAI